MSLPKLEELIKEDRIEEICENFDYDESARMTIQVFLSVVKRRDKKVALQYSGGLMALGIEWEDIMGLDCSDMEWFARVFMGQEG
jgi:hypothetical protein